MYFHGPMSKDVVKVRASSFFVCVWFFFRLQIIVPVWFKPCIAYLHVLDILLIHRLEICALEPWWELFCLHLLKQLQSILVLVKTLLAIWKNIYRSVVYLSHFLPSFLGKIILSSFPVCSRNPFFPHWLWMNISIPSFII